MSTIDEQGLAAGVVDVLDDANTTGEPVFVLRDGEPVAALFPFNHDAVADWLRDYRREFTEAMDAADAATAQGRPRDDTDKAEADAELGGEG